MSRMRLVDRGCAGSEVVVDDGAGAAVGGWLVAVETAVPTASTATTDGDGFGDGVSGSAVAGGGGDVGDGNGRTRSSCPTCNNASALNPL